MKNIKKLFKELSKQHKKLMGGGGGDCYCEELHQILKVAVGGLSEKILNNNQILKHLDAMSKELLESKE